MNVDAPYNNDAYFDLSPVFNCLGNDDLEVINLEDLQSLEQSFYKQL